VALQAFLVIAKDVSVVVCNRNKRPLAIIAGSYNIGIDTKAAINKASTMETAAKSAAMETAATASTVEPFMSIGGR
jgi:hypothetical protein